MLAVVTTVAGSDRLAYSEMYSTTLSSETR